MVVLAHSCAVIQLCASTTMHAASFQKCPHRELIRTLPGMTAQFELPQKPMKLDKTD